MADDGSAQPGLTRRPRTWQDQMYWWAVGAALLLTGLGLWKIGVWADHWYTAEQHLDAAGASGAPPFQDMWELLRSGNDALVDGVSRLAGAAACLVAAVIVRHGWHGLRRRSATPQDVGPASV